MTQEEKWQKTCEAYDRWSEAFDTKTRYAIRGKVGTKYEGLSYGVGIASSTSNQVYIYDEKEYAERELKDLIANRKLQNGDDLSDLLEIHEVHKDELYTTYRKARII